MAGQQVILLDARVEAELERGVPRHLNRSFARTTDNTAGHVNVAGESCVSLSPTTLTARGSPAAAVAQIPLGGQLAQICGAARLDRNQSFDTL
jgi:hypothetical protein